MRPNLDYRLLFESVPGLYLVLDPSFRIVAASDAYLAATMRRREELIVRDLFEVFPDDPQDPMADGVTIHDDWRALGMCGTGSHTVELDGVFVPEESVVLRRPRGQYHAFWDIVLTVALPLIMSAYTGVAEAAAKIADLGKSHTEFVTYTVFTVLTVKSTKPPLEEGINGGWLVAGGTKG